MCEHCSSEPHNGKYRKTNRHGPTGGIDVRGASIQGSVSIPILCQGRHLCHTIPQMAAAQNTIAVVFDFDDTLTDDSTTKLLEAYSIDPVKFWQQDNKALVDAGWNPTLSYLKLILDNVGDEKPFGKLTNADLRKLGASLDFYDGIPELFDDLRNMA